MTFELFPVLDKMIDFYHSPLGNDRFSDYLKILEVNSKKDMEFPVANFNPMGKEHVLTKLLELKKLDIEGIIDNTLVAINKKVLISNSTVIKVAMTLADDLKGGWTNRHVTDYDSKFNINGYLNRNFCIPLFWTSEEYDIDTIKRRTEEYCFRTIYWKKENKPETLEEHINQEQYVNAHGTAKTNIDDLIGFSNAENFYSINKDSSVYNKIFNFMYGDDACRSLGYVEFGNTEPMTGYRYAHMKNQ